MKYVVEESLSNFKFWSGACDTAKYLTYEELDTIEYTLEELYFDREITDTEINDIFWFEEDWIAEMLGYEDWETFLEMKNKKDILSLDLEEEL